MKEFKQIDDSYEEARKQIEELASYIDLCYSEESNREKTENNGSKSSKL